MSELKIQTSQNVTLEFTAASVGDRILAHIIDYLIFFAWFLIFLLTLGVLGKDLFNTTIGPVSITLFMILPILFYDLLCEIFMNGQSVGKIAMKIKVLKLDGSHPTIGAYLMRWIFRVFDRGLIALITIAVNNKGQRLGDIAAGTTVVKLRNPVSLEDLVTEKTDINYVLTFPEASLLSDKDIVTLRAVVRKYEREGNEDLLEQAALKVKSVTNISTELDDLTFLNKILQDHTHLMTAE
ncbi:Uncharacterized membrane protein YckC, RDD family [Pseudarcicella hirudinis]|uniref:Uncharacterized membrane protein YckC, RDD family n=3 Tax=Pseudarcicella hirudinis TaxID=1079859 RepID=A0A1I5QML0_9BACT|nr:RDD family protein [Pseudarcicella hirudinis]SFP47327.1 Uncharacterized membrane protein YckC, RDD family [Pseudarcicella hirudinis]